VLGQTVGNTLEVLIAAMLFYRLAEGRTQFGRVRDVGALVAAAVAGTAVSAVFGAASLRLGGIIPSAQLATVWRTWFLGDLSGALVFAPLLLCWLGVRVDAIAPRQALEGVAIATLIVVLALLPSQRDVPYIVFPVLIWAALRGGPRGAAGAVALATHAHRLQHRTPRRPVYTGNDHPKPARYAVVRGRGSRNVAGARCGH
jgi:integral membrane sensor domain MASE1